LKNANNQPHLQVKLKTSEKLLPFKPISVAKTAIDPLPRTNNSPTAARETENLGARLKTCQTNLSPIHLCTYFRYIGNFLAKIRGSEIFTGFDNSLFSPV
jgi:hypothetical protein